MVGETSCSSHGGGGPALVLILNKGFAKNICKGLLFSCRCSSSLCFSLLGRRKNKNFFAKCSRVANAPVQPLLLTPPPLNSMPRSHCKRIYSVKTPTQNSGNTKTSFFRHRTFQLLSLIGPLCALT